MSGCSWSRLLFVDNQLHSGFLPRETHPPEPKVAVFNLRGGYLYSYISIFVFMLVELTNTVFVNSTNITTNIEAAVLSIVLPCFALFCPASVGLSACNQCLLYALSSLASTALFCHLLFYSTSTFTLITCPVHANPVIVLSFL